MEVIFVNTGSVSYFLNLCRDINGIPQKVTAAQT